MAVNFFLPGRPVEGTRRQLILLGMVGVIASIAWWQSFYSQVIGRAPIECLYQLTCSCRIVSNVSEFFGGVAYDPRLLWASGVVGTFDLFLLR